NVSSIGTHAASITYTANMSPLRNRCETRHPNDMTGLDLMKLMQNQGPVYDEARTPATGQHQ
ncbi:MAG: hypothetical protein VW456_11105, partial [Alphaproteobacteria bacterium]